jgi:hypothetical protein
MLGSRWREEGWGEFIFLDTATLSRTDVANTEPW